jgi:hypothetical protein
VKLTEISLLPTLYFVLCNYYTFRLVTVLFIFEKLKKAGKNIPPVPKPVKIAAKKKTENKNFQLKA